MGKIVCAFVWKVSLLNPFDNNDFTCQKQSYIAVCTLQLSKSRVDEVIICEAKPSERFSLNAKISLVKYIIKREWLSCAPPTRWFKINSYVIYDSFTLITCCNHLVAWRLHLNHRLSDCESFEGLKLEKIRFLTFNLFCKILFFWTASNVIKYISCM